MAKTARPDPTQLGTLGCHDHHNPVSQLLIRDHGLCPWLLSALHPSCCRLLWSNHDGISSSSLLLPRFFFFLHIFPSFKESGKIVQQVIWESWEQLSWREGGQDLQSRSRQPAGSQAPAVQPWRLPSLPHLLLPRRPPHLGFARLSFVFVVLAFPLHLCALESCIHVRFIA